MNKLFNLLLCLIVTALISPEHTLAQVPTAPIPSVESLKDVSPTDWADRALRSLIEQYDLVAGYADNTFHGTVYSATLRGVFSF